MTNRRSDYERRYDLYRQRRVKGGLFPEDSYREIAMSPSIVFAEGGWYYGRDWITGPELREATQRWAAAEYSASPGYPGFIEHQCGGCRFFGALDGDWGICLNAASPHDGRIVFEHVGCEQHSLLTVAAEAHS